MTRVDVVEFLTELGVQRVSKRGDEVYYSCPFDGHVKGDTTPSASMNAVTGGFNCFTCGRHGNAVAFLSELEGVSPIIAQRWIRQRFGKGPGPNAAPDSVEERIRKELEQVQQDARRVVPIPEEHLKSRLVDWELVHNEYGGPDHDKIPGPLVYALMRFPWRTLQDREFGYDADSDMICFPYRDSKGQFIGLKGRAWRDGAIPKYRVLGDKYEEGGIYGFRTLDVSLAVFGIERIEPNGEPLIVTEGELN